MPLTVLQVAFAFAPVGPNAVGGAEEILGALDRALIRTGYRSLVVACEGSEAAGTLFAAPLPTEALGNLSPRAKLRGRNAFQDAIYRALGSAPVDLVHMHGLDFAEYQLPPEIPVLVTLHMPLAWYTERYPGLWKSLGANVHLQCVSARQRRSCPPALRPVAVIPNGVEWQPEAQQLPAPEDVELPSTFALALGRICPEKNVADALRAGTLAGLPVLIGGEVFRYQAHQRYFDEEVAPLLRSGSGPRHRFLGPLSPARRQHILARAHCLLHPTLAPETSSLVAMEALAAGTPVIAYPSGALPEIVEHAVTGFLVESPQEMAAAIPLIPTLSRELCRSTARQRFSRETMLKRYLALYRKLLRSNAAAVERSDPYSNGSARESLVG